MTARKKATKKKATRKKLGKKKAAKKKATKKKATKKKATKKKATKKMFAPESVTVRARGGAMERAPMLSTQQLRRVKRVGTDGLRQ